MYYLPKPTQYSLLNSGNQILKMAVNVNIHSDLLWAFQTTSVDFEAIHLNVS